MIHEFIDYKKKAKNSGANNGKTLRDSIETCSADQSGSECPTTTTFFPPWLRNNLGLKAKNDHNLDWSVCLPNIHALVQGTFDYKPEKLCPEIKKSSQYERNEGEDIKSSVEENDGKKPFYFESSQKKPDEERFLQTSESYRKVSSAEKQNQEESNDQVPVIWRVRPKLSNAESSCTDSEMSTRWSRMRNFKTTETGLKSPTDTSQVKNEEKKKQKISKKRFRLKHRIASHRSVVKEIDVDSLLEEKAKEILENYAKKKVHSAASDIKRFEAKLILLHTKTRLGKLTPDEIQLLQEVKAKAGSEENFDKLIQYVKKVNLKEIIDTQACILKSVQAKKNEEDTKTQPPDYSVKPEESKTQEEVKGALSTDDENDIKRFSELLRKNQNQEEKRKCLEDVRNYFEKKRRTMMTKCGMLNVHLKQEESEGKEERRNVKKNMKKALSDRSAADWRSKLKITDSEKVGKAVDETLQKFVEMYNFRVSPSVMSSMKNNVLKGIQCHSFDCESPPTGCPDLPYSAEGDKLPSKLQKNIVREDDEFSWSKLMTKNLSERTLPCFQLNKNSTVPLKNEQMMQLKTELENHINTNEEVTKFKVQSVILGEENRYSNRKKIEFIYSFTKNSLEQKKSESVVNIMKTLSLKNMEVQVGKAWTVANADTQTQKTLYEKCVQVGKNPQKSTATQTEGTHAIESKNLNETDASAGLYRMVRSKMAGRFYLYPENEQQFSNSLKLSKFGTSKKGKFKEEERSETSGENEPDKQEREVDVPEILIFDEVKSQKDSLVQGKQECVWLWDGKEINSGVDLKFHVENLLREKLKEVCRCQENEKKSVNAKLLMHDFAKPCRADFQDNAEFTISDSKFLLKNENLELGAEDKVSNFGEESGGKKSFEEPLTPFSGEKLKRDTSTQNTEGFFFILKKHKSSKNSSFRKKRRIRMKRDRQSVRSIANLKKAMELMNRSLSNKRMKLEVDSSLKDSLYGSGTTLQSNTSFNSKDTNDNRPASVLGLKNNQFRKDKKNNKMVSEMVQTNNEIGSEMNDVAQRQESCPGMENHKHWELIERVLYRMNRKERENLWMDMRGLIKSKIGKDIENENAKEVCIQIEQDVQEPSEEKTKHPVLAKGYYTRNEGDVEVEIDLTLNDLQQIIRRRERNLRRHGLQHRRKGRSLRSSSSGQSRLNFASMEQFRNILKTVSKPRPNQLP